MRGTFRLVLLVVVGLLATQPSPLQAGDCKQPTEPQLVIFSNTGPNGEVPTLNTAAATCTVIPEADDHYNLHRINPGSTHVQVRWTADIEGVQEIHVVLNGLGFQETGLVARRTANSLREDRFHYDTDVVAIPDGPAAQGAITARAILSPDVLLGQVTFHTVGG